MSLSALKGYLGKMEKAVFKKADLPDEENEGIDVNDAQMTFATWVGAIQGGIKHYQKGVDPKIIKLLIDDAEQFYEETQKPENWEENGRWAYPTYTDQLYISLADEILGLMGILERENLNRTKRE